MKSILLLILNKLISCQLKNTIHIYVIWPKESHARSRVFSFNSNLDIDSLEMLRILIRSIFFTHDILDLQFYIGINLTVHKMLSYLLRMSHECSSLFAWAFFKSHDIKTYLYMYECGSRQSWWRATKRVVTCNLGSVFKHFCFTYVINL